MVKDELEFFDFGTTICNETAINTPESLKAATFAGLEVAHSSIRTIDVAYIVHMPIMLPRSTRLAHIVTVQFVVWSVGIISSRTMT